MNTAPAVLEYVAIMIGSALLTVLLVPLALRLALRRGGSAEPPADSAAPLLGGAAIVTAFSLVVFALALVSPPATGIAQLAVVLTCAVTLALVGLLDDLRHVRAGLRLLAIAGAAAVLWLADVRIELFPVEALNFALTVLWIVGITTAFNLLDNIDGLSAGVAGLGGLAFAVIAIMNDQYSVAALSAALAGCSLGFLRHNYFPARIRMGDAGSLFLGLLLAVLGIKLRFEAPTGVTFLVPILVLGVAIFDTTLVVLTRIAAGRSPFQGGRDHTSHRLVAAGLPVPAAVAILYAAAFALGWLGVVASRLTDPGTAYLLAGLPLLIGLVAGVTLASTLPAGESITGLTPVGAVFKRVFDVVVGTGIAVLATPLILIIAAASAVMLRAWPFFVQERIGRHGRTFRFWKIRTLPPHAPPYALKTNFDDDLKVRRFARFLRERHLDELPQLYAVPLGRMSLVGPRPKMPDEFEPVPEEYARLRTRVPQGCTCLWQVGIHTEGLPSDSPEYDYWYLRHWSMRLDLWILWRTALTLIGAGRQMSLSDIPVWMVGRRYATPGADSNDPTQAELDRRLTG
jgi:UDP-GlcNAc:undecaprenyl-phosphate GlcNAc-1-phosphate transferase